MPDKHLPLVTRLTRQIGNKKYDAHAEAVAILRDRGHMYQNSEKLTKEGERRQAMGPDGRAIDRAARASGRPESDFKYVRGKAVLK
jgi:hypothetical protein